MWILVPTALTEAQFWAGAKALRLSGLSRGLVKIDPTGETYPALVGPNRPTFLCQYLAMIEAAPQPHDREEAPPGRRWVPMYPSQDQWFAAVKILGLAAESESTYSGDSHCRREAVAMYRAMNRAGVKATRTPLTRTPL